MFAYESFFSLDKDLPWLLLCNSDVEGLFHHILDSHLNAVYFSFQIKVEVSVVFLKIGEIDTLKEQYEADVLIQSKWREPLLDKDKVQVSSKRSNVQKDGLFT